MPSNRSRLRKRAAARKRIGMLIEKAIEGIESKLNDTKDKMTLSDCMRVMALQKDFDDERPTEVRVTWVDPEPKNDE